MFCCFFVGDSTKSGGGGGVGGKGLALSGEVFLLLFFFLGGGEGRELPELILFVGSCGLLKILISIKLVICFLKFWSISTFSLEVDDYTPQKSNLHHETLKNDGVWSQVENNLLFQGKKTTIFRWTKFQWVLGQWCHQKETIGRKSKRITTNRGFLKWWYPSIG